MSMNIARERLEGEDMLASDFEITPLKIYLEAEVMDGVNGGQLRLSKINTEIGLSQSSNHKIAKPEDILRRRGKEEVVHVDPREGSH